MISYPPAGTGNDSSPGELVRRFRQRAALTQEELARLGGLSVRAVRDIEHDRVHRPRADTLDRLAEPLRLSDGEQDALGRAFRTLPAAAVDLRVRLDILGPVRALRRVQPLPLGQPLQRTLFGLLTLRCNEFVGYDEIVNALWGERPPRTWLRQAQAMAGRLRRVLADARPAPPGADVVRRMRGGYLLEIDPDLVERLLDAARRTRADAGSQVPVEAWRAAIDCWRGDALADTNDELRTHPSATALARRRIEAVLGYADAAAAAGRHGDAVDALQTVAQSERLHEGIHARLVLALAGTGDRAAALRHWDAVCQRLSEELGIAPDERLRKAQLTVVACADARGGGGEP
jgi:DNA-binding SARP family transcriptional activator/DNA-binding XRE family transcriptional regulator